MEMTISRLIAALDTLQKEHGDLPVNVWCYGGGLDDLCDVKPQFDKEYQRVILSTSRSADDIRR